MEFSMDNHDIFPHAIPSSLVETLRTAQRVTVLTGAGISAESGLPTFRDPMTGLWAQYRPEDLASPQGFQRNPRLVWEWYAWRREMVAQAAPNAGHQALATLEQHISEFTLVTQNIDSLHQRAGSQRVIELHGNISRTKCFEENMIVESWEESAEVPPRCPRCGGRLRPDVVWFGENLPEQAFQAAVEAAVYADVFFAIGTSGTVEPAASLARVAQRFGATVVILNLDVEPLEAPPLYHIHGRAGSVLPALVQATWPVI
jgi:NAD-dependent deacetylase